MNTSEKLFTKFNSINRGKQVSALLFFVVLSITFPMYLLAQPTYTLTGYVYTNASAGDENGVVWPSVPIANVCAGNYTVEYTVVGDGSPVLQYRINSGVWQNLDPSPATVNAGLSSTLEFGLMVTALQVGQTVTIDILAYEAISLSEAKTNANCNGSNDGTITITPSCGEDDTYSFNWTTLPSGFLDPGNDGSITGLVPGDYQVTVENASGNTAVSSLITITEPAIGVSFSLSTVKNWTCADPCSGSISVTASGGIPPYRYFLNGTEGTQPFNDLCGAILGTTYTVRVEDANGCTATPETRDTIIRRDITPPNCTTNFPPPDRLIETSSFPATAEIDTFAIGFAGYTCLGGVQPHPYNLDTVDYPIDASNFNGLQLKMSVSQTDVATWDGTNDFIKVRISYNGGAIWNDLLTDFCNWNASITNEAPPGGTCAGTIAALPTALINLNNADGVPNLVIQVICHSTDATREYTVHDLMVRGNNITKSITWALSGEPSGCSDNYSVATITHNDGPITWYCNAPGNLEFEFQREWRVADQCNNLVIKYQRISVGTYPTFAVAPPDTIFDNCKVLVPVNITGPEGADNCGTPTITWAVTTNGDLVSPKSGTGNSISNITFPPPVQFDTTYVITWTVTDSAGFPNTAVQNVKVRPPMVINFVPVAAHFCSGTNASFTLSVSGGTGSYEIPSFTPEGTWTVLTNSSGTYSTTNLVLGETTDIEVTWTDSNVAETGGTNGGCSVVSTYTNTGLYTIHPKISTNSLQRVP
jgi:hypothetical protein